MKKILLFAWEFLQIILISLAIIIPIRYYVVQPFFVKGASMEPNFEDNDYLIIDELSYHFRQPGRGEVIVFHFPQNTKQFYIKRIIGLPGEKIKIADNKIYVYNKENPEGMMLDEKTYLPTEILLANYETTLNNDSYFVMGDNRLHSFDSRGWGNLERKYIVGKVLFRVWPFGKAMAFGTPNY